MNKSQPKNLVILTGVGISADFSTAASGRAAENVPEWLSSLIKNQWLVQLAEQQDCCVDFKSLKHQRCLAVKISPTSAMNLALFYS